MPCHCPIIATIAVLLIASATACSSGPLRTSEETCVQVLQVPPQYLYLMWSYQYRDDHHIRQLMRCAGMLNGFIIDGGVNFDAVYEKLVMSTGNSVTTKEEFLAESHACIAAIPSSDGIPQEVNDAAWAVYKCFERDYQSAIRCEDMRYSQCRYQMSMISQLN